ncbi:unnamed protein product [Rangifer tarandus platyrhynchus]|uniref:Uncharacterized protein n=2 Tax=Rangifer tarandus platyrhynchus TaxID=3082113 RepID=A0ABN8YEC4_RANTA|nr:unnamed protein product [Rangifer tarandus platyrhynchus]CAI9696085.1 unnamed protein product [Rangifer tarandus platyrhynchus]
MTGWALRPWPRSAPRWPALWTPAVALRPFARGALPDLRSLSRFHPPARRRSPVQARRVEPDRIAPLLPSGAPCAGPGGGVASEHLGALKWGASPSSARGRGVRAPVRLRLGFPGDSRPPSLRLSGRARAAALSEEGRSARAPLWLPQPESPPCPVRGNGGRGPGETDGETDSGPHTSKSRARVRRRRTLPPPPAPTVGAGPAARNLPVPSPGSRARAAGAAQGLGMVRALERRPAAPGTAPAAPQSLAAVGRSCLADACFRTPTCLVSRQLRAAAVQVKAARVWGQIRVPPPSPLQPFWEDRFPQPLLVLVRGGSVPALSLGGI